MQILGVKIDNLTVDQALQKVEGFLEDGQQHYIVTLNPEFLVLAQKDRGFQRILNQADLAVADGVGLKIAAWFLGQSLKERLAGVDLMEKICATAAQKNWSIFLYGGENGVAKKVAENLRKRYPELHIAICPRTVLGGAAKDSPWSILFVALGAPKQEKWIVQNLPKMPEIKLAMGVGGAFDFISGRLPRAPKILRQIGCEWLWRLTIQPWRLKRIFRAVVIFPWLVVKERFRS